MYIHVNMFLSFHLYHHFTYHIYFIHFNYTCTLIYRYIVTRMYCFGMTKFMRNQELSSINLRLSKQINSWMQYILFCTWFTLSWYRYSAFMITHTHAHTHTHTPTHPFIESREVFEDTKGVIRIRKSKKDRQQTSKWRNEKGQKDKQRSTKH
jgi:hypothetical protein